MGLNARMAAEKELSKLRAKELAKNDYLLLRDLIQIRVDSDLSQKDVAEKLGISQQAVSKFEKLDADPKLSTIRMYAHAIGALVGHVVVKDSGQLLSENDWIQARFTTRISSTSAPEVFTLSPRFTSKNTDYSLAA